MSLQKLFIFSFVLLLTILPSMADELSSWEKPRSIFDSIKKPAVSNPAANPAIPSGPAVNSCPGGICNVRSVTGGGTGQIGGCASGNCGVGGAGSVGGGSSGGSSCASGNCGAGAGSGSCSGNSGSGSCGNAAGQNQQWRPGDKIRAIAALFRAEKAKRRQKQDSTGMLSAGGGLAGALGNNPNAGSRISGLLGGAGAGLGSGALGGLFGGGGAGGSNISNSLGSGGAAAGGGCANGRCPTGGAPSTGLTLGNSGGSNFGNAVNNTTLYPANSNFSPPVSNCPNGRCPKAG